MTMNQYKWDLNSIASTKLEEIEILRKVFDKLPLPQARITIIRERSFINSAVSSAQIENIPSTIQEPRKEGKNLERTYRWIYSHQNLDNLTPDIIRELHSKVMNGISNSAGIYRREPWGVFNQAGMEVMHAPLHALLPGLMQEFTTFINELSEHPCLIVAIAHFIFEKIHPFADGNGRTGRLISSYSLHKNGFGFEGLVPVEKYINKHRNWYYSTLEPTNNCTGFIEFFLEAIIVSANQILEDIKNPEVESTTTNLLPRRRELLEVIKDHPECTFDFLHRRFLSLPALSLHRDLQHLQKNNFIKKLGSTRGAVYTTI